jgi:hypothetical protein
MTGRRRAPRPTSKRAQQLAVRWARWLLQFAPTELEQLSEGKLGELRADLDSFLRSDSDVRPVSTSGRASNADLRECQEWLRTGLATLARGEGWKIQYEFPPYYAVRLTGVTRVFGVYRPLIPFRQVVFEETVPVLLYRLRFCQDPKCRKPFLRRRRQVYCSSRCSNRHRSELWRKKNPEKASNQRHTRYVNVMKSVHGPKINVKRLRRRPKRADRS